MNCLLQTESSGGVKWGVGWKFVGWLFGFFFFACLLVPCFCTLDYTEILYTNYNKTADASHLSLILNDLQVPFFFFTEILLLCLVDHSARGSRTQIATHHFIAEGVAEK